MKNIVITGASRGIGLELTKQFSEKGHRILALSRNINTLLNSNLKNVKSLAIDLCKPESLDIAIPYIEKKWDGKVDILINNAGKLINKSFSEHTEEDFREVYQVNVFGVAKTIQLLMPFMEKGSHIVTISSMGGVQGSKKFPGLAAYSSSKGAVITLMELLAEEYKDTGIVFNTLALGAVQTKMLEEAFPGYKAPVTASEMASYIFHFSLTASHFYNGKLLQVSKNTP